jgi:hypothetical protein
VGLNYKQYVWYEVDNNIGKITTAVYTGYILPIIKDELLIYSLTLYQDANSVHTSKKTLKWVKEYGILLLTLPGVSPDLSICETIANPLKRAFYGRRSATEKQAKERFMQVFEEMDQETINY